jgi:putative membrane protein
MMSWVRTAVSLIGFGFAIVEFFERMQQMPGVRPPNNIGGRSATCGVGRTPPSPG